MSRTTTNFGLHSIPGLEATSMSTLVTSTSGAELIVERTMRWDASGYGAHTDKATSGAATDWFFAEGAQGFFFTSLLLVNPHATANVAHVTYLREGALTTPQTHQAALVTAHDTPGTQVGRVTDESGAALPGVKVKLENGDESYEATTDGNG